MNLEEKTIKTETSCCKACNRELPVTPMTERFICTDCATREHKSCSYCGRNDLTYNNSHKCWVYLPQGYWSHLCGEYICSECFKKYSSKCKKCLTREIKEHPELYFCSYCGKLEPRKVHWICIGSSCNKPFCSKSDRKYICNECHRNKEYRCKECKKEFLEEIKRKSFG